MLHYILQTVAFQLFFLIIYDVFLKKETFFNWNRLYLLLTAIASVSLPFIKLESVRTIVSKDFVIRLPEVIIGQVENDVTHTPMNISSAAITNSVPLWNWDNLLYTGMVLATVLLIYKLIKISNLIQKNPKQWKENFIIVNLLKSNAAFSFFNYIFLGEWIKDEEKESILKHELVHVSQKHSLDLLLFELLRILFWFNPLIYMYQNRITTLHEYIADAKAMKQSDKKQYYEKLLSQIFDTEHISFTNTFFKQSLIKKRIVMLSKSKSNQIHLLKYALLIPMVFGMLMYTSSYAQKETVSETTVNQEMTYDELIEKYYNEILELAKDKENFEIIRVRYDMSNDKIAKEKYIKSMDEMAKIKAYDKYSAEEFIRSEKKNGTFTEEDQEYVDNVLNRYKTYEEYLAYQKTDEAKSNWESDISNGVLRLAVDDMKNMTEEEKKRREKKFDLIEKDDFFHSLLISDGNASITMQIHSFDGKKIPGPQNEQKIELNDLDIEVPFAVIDEVPTLEECKDLPTNAEKRMCFSNYISDFVNKNFNTKLANDLGLTGKQRISVLFKIGKDGTINEVMARAGHPALEEEAKRVIHQLPKMIPGKQKGKAVVVPYSLPILFMIADKDASAELILREESQNFEDLNEVPFSVVEETPMFEGCQSLSTNDERKQCTTDKITDFVNRNFNAKLAKESGLTGQQRIMVIFKIDKEGNIIDVKSRASSPVLEVESKRVINSIPKMVPGKHHGKNVSVSYSLPILFKVSE